MREFLLLRFKRNGMEMRNVLVQRGAKPSSNVWLEVGWRKVKIRGQRSSSGAAAMGREQAGLCLGFGVPSDHGHDCCMRAAIAVGVESALLCLPWRLVRVEESVVGVGIVGVGDAEPGGFVGTDS
jgi:hypothetical protein